MEVLTAKQEDILKGLICPYCGYKSQLVNSSVIYGTDYGNAYLCKPCDAYVGCHKGTTNSKGRLANKELRKLKIEAHKYFDMIWKLKYMTRTDAYKSLSDYLKLPGEYTHIGMFGAKTLENVIYFSKTTLNFYYEVDKDFGHKPKTEYFEL